MFGLFMRKDGARDSVTIDVRKLSDTELSNIIRQFPKQNNSSIKAYLDSKAKVDYDFTITTEEDIDF